MHTQYRKGNINKNPKNKRQFDFDFGTMTVFVLAAIHFPGKICLLYLFNKFKLNLICISIKMCIQGLF